MSSDPRPGSTPRVSIGMPVRNGQQYLEPALDSILAQSFADFEVIISDNASTDGTQEICEAYQKTDPRISYHRNPRNLGAAANYNVVVSLARGDYFKWAAHDDTCAPDFLARCVEILDREPRVVLAFSRFDYIDEVARKIRSSGPDLAVRGRDAGERTRRLVDLQLQSMDVYWAIFGLIRITALRKTRLIASYIASDQTLLFNLVLMGELGCAPGTLFFRREHSGESMKSHKTPRDRAVWFDTGERKKLYFTNWRLLREHLALVHRQGLSLGQVIRCDTQVLRRFAHKWRALGGEIKLAVRGQHSR